MRPASRACSDRVPAQHRQNVLFLKRKNIPCFENSRLILEEYKPALLPHLSFNASPKNKKAEQIKFLVCDGSNCVEDKKAQIQAVSPIPNLSINFLEDFSECRENRAAPGRCHLVLQSIPLLFAKKYHRNSLFS